jgi:hypothetical protein
MLKRLLVGCALVAGATACAARPFTARTFAGTLDFLYTNNAPIGTSEIKGDSHARFWEPLVNEAAAHQVMVLTVALPEGNMGRYSPTRRIILINEELGPNARVATLLHELGHVFEPPGLTDYGSDVFAETVAVVVAKEIGLDIRMHSAGYFLFHARESAGDHIRQLALAIDLAVKHLLDQLEAVR